MVVDDYGHHPAEIRATLAGARTGFPDRRLVVAFQPHRYTRTRDLMGEFARAFNDADVVVVCDIYAAGEEPIAGVVVGARSSTRCARRATAAPPRGQARRRRRRRSRRELRDGDIVITLGAGDVWMVGEEILKARA